MMKTIAFLGMIRGKERSDLESYIVMTDTSANLPTAVLKKKKIKVVPFLFAVDGKENICLDTQEFDAAAYYEAIRKGALVTTSQINPQKYMDYMRPALEAGKNILFVAMSSGISGAYHSLQMASEQLREEFPARIIETVDTKGASLGEGIPALKAAELCRQGVSLAEAAGQIRSFCHRMCQVFTVDDLMHLKRTGRLSGTAAMVASVLQIKPLLAGNENGEIVCFSKVRGRKKSIEALAQAYQTLAVGNETVGIAHADCPDDAAYLAHLIRQNQRSVQVMTVPYEPVTGSHVGPGALALFFEGGKNVRTAIFEK